ncbi:MAG: hypothetical protein J6P31_05815 [Oscillospiraceae bacterium]|nr:hypothetical protein [Oscillospiraceae bacterium]
MKNMKKKTRNRLIGLAVALAIIGLVIGGYVFVLNRMTVSADKVIKCGQKSEWNSMINASELMYTVQNEYCVTRELNGGSVHGYCLPTGKYGLICFGTANVYIYEALTFDGVTDYYETWIINFYTGSEAIQKNTYTGPGEFESRYVDSFVEIEQADNLVMVNGAVDFYMDPDQ